MDMGKIKDLYAKQESAKNDFDKAKVALDNADADIHARIHRPILQTLRRLGILNFERCTMTFHPDTESFLCVVDFMNEDGYRENLCPPFHFPVRCLGMSAEKIIAEDSAWIPMSQADQEAEDQEVQERALFEQLKAKYGLTL